MRPLSPAATQWARRSSTRCDCLLPAFPVLPGPEGQRAQALLYPQDVSPSDLHLDPHLGLLMLQVTTVDKYQGQQNDIVLLSLVRTRAVGHVRDVRRLVVAMSRCAGAAAGTLALSL